MEGQVLPIARNDLAVLLQPLFHARAVMTLMLHEALWTSVDHVIAASTAKVFRPLEWFNWLQSVQILDCFIDSSGAFFSAKCGATWLLKQITLKTLEHLLQVGNTRARVVSNLVLDFKNLPIHLRNIARQCKLHFY